ncbi:hypothetical protein MKZ24_30155 [Paenibacillus sp. FSL R7-0297]|uniref:hypothetical protein n=1 Tax=unclassified Paenibacillus TaxID=185978 RepID=UPI0004F772C6|nr:hypothetical protein [Paenibacillus sp. FSL R5-0912]AIQ39953.1 hypothetical protein R50912_07875 [Paenibacillus sp. FSL R5-0912]
MAEIQTAKTYYLGIHPYMLDPVSLEFSSFGVLWYEEGKQRYVVGYGFGTDQIETLFHFCRSSAYFTCSNEQVLYNIYTSIRVKQQERDWQTRKRLAFWTAFKEPWKSMPCGWYVLRSRDNFPLHLSVVRKTKYSIWLEHAAVCENEAQLTGYLARVKQTHHLTSIVPMELQEGSIHE